MHQKTAHHVSKALAGDGFCTCCTKSSPWDSEWGLSLCELPFTHIPVRGLEYMKVPLPALRKSTFLILLVSLYVPPNLVKCTGLTCLSTSLISRQKRHHLQYCYSLYKVFRLTSYSLITDLTLCFVSKVVRMWSTRPLTMDQASYQVLGTQQLTRKNLQLSWHVYLSWTYNK